MTALAKERTATEKLGDRALIDYVAVPVKANTKIYQGALVCIDAGYAAPMRTATGLIALGRARATVDNTGGSAGALTIEVERGCFKWNNSSAGDQITQADVLKSVYGVDDQTVAKTDGTGTRSIAGRVMQVNTDGTVMVETTGF